MQELLRHANSRITLACMRKREWQGSEKHSGKCRDGANEREGSGLTGPHWTMTETAGSLQALEEKGGDDETRTRDLCRDSPAS
jgi:hypothetical protein